MSYQDYIPVEILEKYEVHDYRHAAAILCHEFPTEFNEIIDALKNFVFTLADIQSSGGNESNLPKRVSEVLRPMGWMEKKIRTEQIVDGEEVFTDSHFVDYIKGRVAFDMEWNSKDQTFDRDLYAFKEFFNNDRISVAVLLTRSNDLDPMFKRLKLYGKYGASTTHMGKLLPRLRANRNGGCPVLVFGITTASCSDCGK
jgi:hypothetical protein